MRDTHQVVVVPVLVQTTIEAAPGIKHPVHSGNLPLTGCVRLISHQKLINKSISYVELTRMCTSIAIIQIVANGVPV